jgi:hypothetical protein
LSLAKNGFVRRMPSISYVACYFNKFWTPCQTKVWILDELDVQDKSWTPEILAFSIDTIDLEWIFPNAVCLYGR